MSVTSDVPKSQMEWLKLQSKNKSSSKVSTSVKNVDGMEGVNKGNQFLPGEKRDVMYVSRMECLKAAIDWNLKRLLVQYPHKKVILITFNDSVTIVGDASGVPVVIAGDKLQEFDTLKDIGKGYKLEGTRSISDSHGALQKKIQEIEEGGATALGPALLLSIGIASQQARSEIIVCTDGISNIGVGSLDDDISKEQIEKNKLVYPQLGVLAKKYETTVSVIGLEGSEGGCALKAIGSVADMTSGTVNIVQAIELMTQIVKIAQKPIVATDVQVKLVSHPRIIWQDQTKDSNAVVKEIGNATSETDVAFGFSFKKNAKKDEKKAPTSLPFQAQIRFTRPDGYKCIRIITKQTKVTNQREEAEKACNVAVVGLNGVQQAAKIALSGSERDVLHAREKLYSVQRLIQRAANSGTQKEEYFNFVSQSNELDSQLKEVKDKKGNEDATAKVLYKMKGANKNAFLSGERKVVDKRLNANEDLTNMYYNYKMNEDTNYVKE